MSKTTLRLPERPARRPPLQVVRNTRDEEAVVVELLARIRPRPKPWTPPPAA